MDPVRVRGREQMHSFVKLKLKLKSTFVLSLAPFSLFLCLAASDRHRATWCVFHQKNRDGWLGRQTNESLLSFIFIFILAFCFHVLILNIAFIFGFVLTHYLFRNFLYLLCFRFFPFHPFSLRMADPDRFAGLGLRTVSGAFGGVSDERASGVGRFRLQVAPMQICPHSSINQSINQ